VITKLTSCRKKQPKTLYSVKADGFGDFNIHTNATRVYMVNDFVCWESVLLLMIRDHAVPYALICVFATKYRGSFCFVDGDPSIGNFL
jgi:hypothetical protein